MHGTRYQFLISARLYYAVRKDTGTSSAALTRDLKTLKMIGAFLGLPRSVWPVTPPASHGLKEEMPTPEQVHELLHTAWTPNAKRNIENQWLRHVLAAHFGFGLRSPKEFWFLKADFYNPDAGFLKVVEPKKRHRARKLYVEPTWLAHGHSRPSLDNWMKHRDRLSPDSDAMFPNPLTGRDFPMPEAFKAFRDGRVKKRYPWFHGYLARHWSVYARIIDAGFADSSYNAVAEWHGHESVDMTRDTYGPGARAYAKSPAYGRDWVSRAFAKPRTHD